MLVDAQDTNADFFSMQATPVYFINTADIVDSAAIIMQNSFTWSFCYSAALSYDTQNGVTSAFIHGLRGSELNALTVQLIENRNFQALPTLLPYLLLNMRGSFAMATVLQCYQHIVEIECGTGVKTCTEKDRVC